MPFPTAEGSVQLVDTGEGAERQEPSTCEGTRDRTPEFRSSRAAKAEAKRVQTESTSAVMEGTEPKLGNLRNLEGQKGEMAWETV